MVRRARIDGRHHRRIRTLDPAARRSSVGATLVEVVLALAILVVVLVPAAAFLVAGVRSAVSSSVRSTALSLLSAEVSKLDAAFNQYYPMSGTSSSGIAGSAINPPVCNPFYGSVAIPGQNPVWEQEPDQSPFSNVVNPYGPSAIGPGDLNLCTYEPNSPTNPKVTSFFTPASAYWMLQHVVTASGSIQPLLPTTETVGNPAQTFTFTYTPTWISSESAEPPSQNCASTGSSPFPPAMIHVQVAVTYYLQGTPPSTTTTLGNVSGSTTVPNATKHTVTSDVLIDTPFSYFSQSQAYFSVYGGPNSAGARVWLHGTTLAATPGTYVTTFDQNGCAFFINVNGAAPNATTQATYIVGTTYTTVPNSPGTVATANACIGQTTYVDLYAIQLGARQGGFGGCGNVQPTQAAFPDISATPASLTFAVLGINNPTPPQTVTIQNTGNYLLQLNSEAVTGTNASNFAITSNTCGQFLYPGTGTTPGQTCTVSIVFTGTNPDASQPFYAADLTINSDAVNASTLQVPLSATVLFSNDVLEQNLDSAGRIRVALPTNPGGQVQVSGGSAGGTAQNGPWATVGCCGATITMASINGPGVFRGLTMNTYGWACGCWNPDGSVIVIIDGQMVFNYAQSNLAANWLSDEGGVMGGQWRPGWCGGGACATSYWKPPGGIAFQNNVTVEFTDWTSNPEQVWTEVYWNSVPSVSSSPN